MQCTSNALLLVGQRTRWAAGARAWTAQPKWHQVSGYSRAPSKQAAHCGQPALPQCRRPPHSVRTMRITSCAPAHAQAASRANAADTGVSANIQRAHSQDAACLTVCSKQGTQY